MERLSQSVAFHINAPRVAHQTLDGETIIIDFQSGAYFSTNDTGAAIWRQIAQNASVSQIVQVLRQAYEGDDDVISRGVEQFLAELEEGSLITRLDRAPLVTNAAPVMPNPNPAVQVTFHAPSLNKYTDMQDLLLLDPIHEVDEQGWPVKKDANAE